MYTFWTIYFPPVAEIALGVAVVIGCLRGSWFVVQKRQLRKAQRRNSVLGEMYARARTVASEIRVYRSLEDMPTVTRDVVNDHLDAILRGVEQEEEEVRTSW